MYKLYNLTCSFHNFKYLLTQHEREELPILETNLSDWEEAKAYCLKVGYQEDLILYM